MKCIILAAGYSTRLYPLTKDLPKPLLPIAGIPMIEHILKKIAVIEEIDQIFVVTNNKFFDNFRNWKRKFSFSKPITIINDKTNNNEERLGAVGDISFVLKEVNIQDDFMVVGGDNLFKFDLSRLYELFKEKNAPVIALYDVKNKEIAAGKYGIVEINEDKKIIALEEKPKEPKTTLVSTACYIFTVNVIDEIKNYCSEKNADNIGDFIHWLLKRDELYGEVFIEKWFDIGTKDQLKQANEEWDRT